MTSGEINRWQPVTPANIEWHDTTPYAPDFADHYHSLQQGVAESNHVFIHGNNLPQRFAVLKAGQIFSIGETGFGSGLNLLLTAHWFRHQATAAACLQLVSTELHPLQMTDLKRALKPWQAELDDDLVTALLAQYPPAAAGFHRLQLAANISLTLALGDAAQMLGHCRCDTAGHIDAWFLDGFAPKRNPAMWSQPLCEQLARLSRPGATLASYSVAGSVRRALTDVGFDVRKNTGFGRKRECLQGAWQTASALADVPDAGQPARLRHGVAAVIGAGLAGATTARALAERGWQVQVIDPAGVANAASGNRLGVIYATPAATWSAQSRFYLHSYISALRWLRQFRAEAHGIAGLNGVVQHIAHDRQQHKLAQALSNGIWPEALLQQSDERTFVLPGGGWLRPQAWCQLLLQHPAIELRTQKLSAWQTHHQHTRIQLENGSELTTDVLVFCTGAGTMTLPGLRMLPLQVVRGQVSEVAATGESEQWDQVQCHAGYLTPAIDGVHSLGASYESMADSDAIAALATAVTLSSTDAHDQYNLETLRHHLPQRWRALGGDNIRLLGSRSGLRCRTADYLPVLGALDGHADIWVNTAHGSRGISSTTLCADLLADSICGLMPAADHSLLQALAVQRLQ